MPYKLEVYEDQSSADDDEKFGTGDAASI